MKHDSMVEALRSKKPGALDITITIGQPEEELGASEGLMSEDGEGLELSGGEFGNEPNEAEEEDSQRRELDLAPTAPEMIGDLPPEVANDEQSEREMIQGELEKASFGKGSMMARKKNELSKTRV